MLCAALIAAKWTAQVWLEGLNQRHARRHAHQVPPALAGAMTPETYAKSVDYTLAKSRFEMVELTWGVMVLCAVLFSGVLPWFYRPSNAPPAPRIWARAAYLVAVGVALSAADLPFDWHAQFDLEERFGFNTTTAATWWMDRLKGLLLALALGYPLLRLDSETGGLAGGGLVVLGLGLPGRFSTGDDGGRAGLDSAALQQIHPAAAGRTARGPARTGPPRRLSRPRHPGDGREQTLAPLQRLFHRPGPLPQNRSF